MGPPIVNAISDAVRFDLNNIYGNPKIAVYISGGIDSTILLHHLLKMYAGEIHAYSMVFPGDLHATAKKVAVHYMLKHYTEVPMGDFIKDLPDIMKSFDRPRYNVWPYYMVREAWKDGCEVAFLGEGGDENFGYDDRDYLTGWANHICYVIPTYTYLHRRFQIDLRLPYRNINPDWSKKYWSAGKKALRTAYRGVLPDFVVESSSQPPNFANYLKLWEKYLSKTIAGCVPKDDDGVRMLLQYIVAKAWTKMLEEEGIYEKA